MEEWVGLKWHEYVTRQAMGEFPEHTVHLKDEARTLGVLFRAMGGDPALSLVVAEPRQFQIRRRFLHKLAGTHRKFELAWRDEDSLRLPDRLALFPSRKANRDLYLWLAALASLGEIHHHSWLEGNQAMVQKLLSDWPGLEPMYQRLVRHTLQWRPEPDSLPGEEAKREAAIRQALIHPGSITHLPDAMTDPWPVILWLYPVLGRGRLKGQIIGGDDNTQSKSGGLAKKRKRRRAERVDAFDKDQGIMLFRLESLFSWSEFIPVDRAGDDSDEDDADSVADDMDMISISMDRREASSAIKFDLDLPSEENDDLFLGPGIHLPEWDWRRQGFRDNFCCLQPLLSRDAVPSPLPERLKSPAQTLRRQFSALKPLRQWERRQREGEELDRVLPVIKRIKAARPDCVISIDTMKPGVAAAAIEAGAWMWNDVNALNAPGALDMAARLGCVVCLMHMQGRPGTMQAAPEYDEVVTDVARYLGQRAGAAIASGVAREAIWLDPGIGFGKTVAHNLALIAAMENLCAFGFPILFGASRKRFISAIDETSPDSADRLGGSLAAALHAARAGCAIVRVHDVKETVQALKIQAAIRAAALPS